MATLELTSAKNPRIKALMALSKGKERAAQGVFSVEGAREIERALTAGYAAVEAFLAPGLLSEAAQKVLNSLPKACAQMSVSDDLYGRIAMREDKDGLVVVFNMRSHTLKDLPAVKAPLIIAMEAVEKPGNLGALLRSADGAGVSAVVAVGSGADFYHPHVIRNSLGTVFSVPVAAASLDELVAYAKKNGLKIFAAALTNAAISCFDADLTQPCVIMLGTEATGLTAAALAQADQAIKIPMAGIADSLNVSAAGTVIIYEASRQWISRHPTSRR